MAGELPSNDWRMVKLGDLGEVNRGRSRHRPRYAEHLYGGPYPFIQTGDIRLSGGRITKHTQTYSEAGLDQSRLWPAGTMCITIAANIAETAILSYPACFPDSVVGFIADESKCDVRFVEYTFRHLRRRLQHEATGSVQDNINLATLDRLVFPLPPLREQQAIACILGALDDKIELNRRMNRTLEAMARAIFKSWFVDFLPVRANMTRTQTGDPVRRNKDEGGRMKNEKGARSSFIPHPSSFAALFPDAFEDSELGEIPKGWRVGRVADVADVFSGKRPDVRYSEATEDARIPLWGGNGPMAFVPEPLIDYPILLTGRVGTLGSVFRITSPCWPSDNTLILRAKHEQAYEYLFLQLCRIDFSSLNRGSTQPLLTQTDLKAQLLPLPPSGLLERFHLIVDSLFLRFDSADIESRTLAALRDALLPKLISGEIRVKDAERVVGRAV